MPLLSQQTDFTMTLVLLKPLTSPSYNIRTITDDQRITPGYEVSNTSPQWTFYMKISLRSHLWQYSLEYQLWILSLCNFRWDSYDVYWRTPQIASVFNRWQACPTKFEKRMFPVETDAVTAKILVSSLKIMMMRRFILRPYIDSQNVCTHELTKLKSRKEHSS
jgi:hypothetical protein